MSVSKYAVCEEYEVPNFDENFEEIKIPIIAPRFAWRLYIGTAEDLLYASIYLSDDDKGSRYGLHYSIQFLNQKDPTKNSEGVDRKGIAELDVFLHGDDLCFPEVLKEENGFLKDEVIKVRVCFHVESRIVSGEATLFNFAHHQFDYIEKGNTLRLEWMRDSSEIIYVHHQAVKLHSKTLSDAYGDAKGNISLLVPPDINIDDLHVCLQMMHGVFFEDIVDSSVLRTAFDFRMKNVMWIIERQLIEVKEYRKKYENLILNAMMFRMERLLKHLLVDIDTIEEFKEILQKIEIYKMSSESMKAVVARFLAYD